jgi:16S rRNA (adenine1518-N6/adenine1519-N6)-dimethyltransferase
MSLPVVPKKSLGQNFLNSQRVITRIRDAADPTSDDIILEIGPGLGALTKILLAFAGKVIAVEKDDALYNILSETFTDELKSKKLDLINGDILDFNPETLRFYKNFTYKVVANIPYNLTGLIFRKFLTASYQPESMVVLIQKEVATRIIARDGKESLLSLSVKIYGTPKLVTHVARGNFNPVPNVDSSVIKIDAISKDNFETDRHEEIFFELIHAGFAHKRKMLIKNLIDAGLHDRSFWEPLFLNRKLASGIRAEDLTIDDWVYLTKMVYTTE